MPILDGNARVGEAKVYQTALEMNQAALIREAREIIEAFIILTWNGPDTDKSDANKWLGKTKEI